MERKTIKVLLWILTIAILGGSVGALYATGFFQAAGSPQAMGDYIARCAPWSHLAYFGVQLVSVVVAPIPSNITAAAGAWLFGMWPAFLLTWGAVTLGSCLVFALARAWARDSSAGFVSEKLSDDTLTDPRKTECFCPGLLFPFFPDDIPDASLAGAATTSPFRQFSSSGGAGQALGAVVCLHGGQRHPGPSLWAMALAGRRALPRVLLCHEVRR